MTYQQRNDSLNPSIISVSISTTQHTISFLLSITMMSDVRYDTTDRTTEQKTWKEGLCNRVNNAFHEWYQSVLDIESFEQKTKCITDALNKSLYRQQLDGLLSSIECAEIRYINSLWHQLMHHIPLYHIGFSGRKREIISLLIELYTHKHITEDMLIESCIDL